MDYDNSVALLRAVAEPTRLRICLLCAKGELSAGELVDILGQSQPRVSRHLKLLTEAGVLSRFSEGAQNYFAIRSNGHLRSLMRWLGDLIDAKDVTISRDSEQLAALRMRRFLRGQALFNAGAENWNELAEIGVQIDNVESLLAAHFPQAPIDLLDLGVGTADILCKLAPRLRSATGVDINPRMLTVARANIAQSSNDHLTVVSSDIYRLSLDDAKFNVCLLFMVLHFLDRPQAAFLEIGRLLKPGGRLLIVDLAPHGREKMRDAHAHQWLGFADSQIQTWVGAAGFELTQSFSLAADPMAVKLWLCIKLASAEEAACND